MSRGYLPTVIEMGYGNREQRELPTCAAVLS
jgi:hypothetical protein